MRLNDWENHRTATDYTDQLIFKTFAFQFINSYMSLFYIAFIKSQVTFMVGGPARTLIIPLLIACAPRPNFRPYKLRCWCIGFQSIMGSSSARIKGLV